MGYKIVEAQAPVLGAGGHNYWVLLDNSGNRVGELHGFQTDANGEPATTGVGGDLKVFTDRSMGYNASTPQAVVFDGTQAEAMALWGAATDCGDLINLKNYDYNAFDSFGGHNSNSVASTLAACMGVTEVNLGSFTPGMGEVILSNSEIEYVRQSYGFSDACVAISSFLPDGRTAGDVRVGDTMQLADEKNLEPAIGEVSYSQQKNCPGFRITTDSGASLVCSDTAPIPTPDGLVLAPDLLGKMVAVRRDDASGTESAWETVIEVKSVGQIVVQHITVGNKCFWAGEMKNVYILHHNLKYAGDGGNGEGNDWEDWPFFSQVPGNTVETVQIIGVPLDLVSI